MWPSLGLTVESLGFCVWEASQTPSTVMPLGLWRVGDRHACVSPRSSDLYEAGLSSDSLKKAS